MMQQQICPYCNNAVDDSEALWSLDAEEKVLCTHCKREYIVKTIYHFQGWEIQKVCQLCGESFMNDFKICDCLD